MLDEMNVRQKVIQTIAGHSDINITMNTYVHSRTKQVMEAGEKTGTVLPLPA